jgi:6-phosphogluconolactonase
VQHDLEVSPDAAAVAARAASYVAALARDAVSARGRFTFAVSGGKTPWAMFAELASEDMPWADVELFQVDERVAPDGDPERNLTHLRQILGSLPVTLIPMPVTDPDLGAAAAACASRLPARFDLMSRPALAEGRLARKTEG